MAHTKDRGNDGKRKRKKRDKAKQETQSAIMHPRMNHTPEQPT